VYPSLHRVCTLFNSSSNSSTSPSNATLTTEIYTLSLHDALPILQKRLHRRLTPQFSGRELPRAARRERIMKWSARGVAASAPFRSEEHTSELQSHLNIVCRLLLEKKKCITFDMNSSLYFTLVEFC